MLGKIEGGRKRGWQRMRWLDGITNSRSLLKLMSIQSVMFPVISSSVLPFSSHLQSFPASGSFQMSALHIRWPKYWSFSISLSSEYSGLISFRINWFDLLAVQGTLKSLLAPQFKSISSSALNLLYGLNLTSIDDFWKNHNFVYMDLCRQGDVSAF